MARQNVYGRRGGRGLRPWLLIPKVIAVAMLLGGLAAVLVTLSGGGDVASVQRLFLLLVIPGSTLAILLGVALTLDAGWRVMLRQRWLVAKLVIGALGLPAVHVWAKLSLDAWEAGNHAAADRLLAASAAALVVTLALLILGRLKPRLGRPAAQAR
jgi:hypothetical protein